MPRSEDRLPSSLVTSKGFFAFLPAANCGSLLVTKRIMGKQTYKISRQRGFILPSRKSTMIIPGLGVDVPELQQARALWQINRFDDSLRLFEKAVHKYPQNLVALVDAS